MGITIEGLKVEAVAMINVYYDFECSFCFRAINRVLKGCKTDVDLSTIQDITPGDKIFEGISREELYSFMWLIDTDSGSINKGYFAFKYIYTRLHSARIVRLMFLIPIFSDFFGVKIYRLVANNRRFAGCESQSCSLHAEPKSE